MVSGAQHPTGFPPGAVYALVAARQGQKFTGDLGKPIAMLFGAPVDSAARGTLRCRRGGFRYRMGQG